MLPNFLVSHFKKCGVAKWDSMISQMWDHTSVSQKCVVGHGLWDKNGYLQAFSVGYLQAFSVVEFWVKVE